ncbi:hypothetical protein RSOLAG1IB_07787 [Rhizoctonia solani AG-1 IB]|uniref:Uncharacterized protein n=1 Tax=Thanatephorus cucumeris (strain AG1-IB / isolate 7/3/14) TaxID=1108050 RepID=A0A0B7FEC9_THACB|nr:hypothetical protein RSOLAG1IB_07787 [Rhizoctonia solani AG-1 IB]
MSAPISQQQSSVSKRRSDENTGLNDDPTYRSIEIPWDILCFLTLGFPIKYRQRLILFRSLHNVSDDNVWESVPTYSDRGFDHISVKPMRQKQHLA